MQKLQCLFLLVSLLAGYYSLAQDIPIGTWRSHASYRSVQSVAVAGERVYAGSTGGLFYFDLSYANTVTLSRQDGLSGTEVGRLAFVPTIGTLIVTYQTGHIDLLQNNQISTIDVLVRTNLTTSRKINHITVDHTTAYLSGDFGVLVLDVAKGEVRDTWRNIGPNGSSVAVWGSTIANGQFYLATSAGVLTAPTTGSNLLDFRSWRTFTVKEGLPESTATAIGTLAGKVYAGFEGKGIYAWEGESWLAARFAANNPIRNISTSADNLLVSSLGRLEVLKKDGALETIRSSAIINPQEAAYDEAGHLWIADAANGLISNREGDFKSYVPGGPLTNQFGRLVSAAGKIIALPGGFLGNYTPSGDTTGFSEFIGGNWQNYAPNIPSAQPIPRVGDLYTAAFNPRDQRFYLGSYGGGLLVKEESGQLSPLNENNSPLKATSPDAVKVTGLAVDAEGNTWVAVYGASFGQPSLFVRHTDGTWQSFAFTTIAARFPLSLTIDDNGYKWLRISAEAGGGIWVFDDKNNRTRYLTTAVGNGGLPHATIHALVKDREGQIWVGTGRGAAVFINPASILGNSGVDAVTPFYERRPLLRDEAVTAIAVDGGNRKWFGTENGLFLFNAAGEALVTQFNRSNAPLPSQAIRDIAVQPLTGEVFIATAAGLVSYRGTATEAPENASGVKVFPNPVRPHFGGLVGISGVAENATVKITDVSGRLVYETRAQGGTAVWNVRDYTGRRAATGIYLIYASDAAGNQTLVSKMAVVE